MHYCLADLNHYEEKTLNILCLLSKDMFIPILIELTRVSRLNILESIATIVLNGQIELNS